MRADYEAPRMLCACGAEFYWFEHLLRPFPPHVHAKCLIGTLVAGRRLLHMGGASRIIGAGELVFIPPLVCHACAPLDNEPARWVCLQAPVDLLPGRMGAAIVADSRQALDCFFEIAAQAANSTLTMPRLALALAQIAAAAASAPWGQPGARPGLAIRPAPGKFQYLRKFKARRGITPTRWQASLRIIKAQRKIRQGMPLAECAVACGFCDQSHMNRVFKASIGLAPGAWRDACQSSAL